MPNDHIPLGGSTPLSMEEQQEIMTNMTPEQIERGLFPRTFEDLRYRASAFAQIDPEKVKPKKKT